MNIASQLELVALIAGGAIALIGLVLLFMRRSEGQNRIKILGQEFEVSTPALVVFLVGSGIFVIPFVLPLAEATSSSQGLASVCPGDFITGAMKPRGGHQTWFIKFDLKSGESEFRKSDEAKVTGRILAICADGKFAAYLPRQSHGLEYVCWGDINSEFFDGICAPADDGYGDRPVAGDISRAEVSTR